MVRLSENNVRRRYARSPVRLVLLGLKLEKVVKYEPKYFVFEKSGVVKNSFRSDAAAPGQAWSNALRCGGGVTGSRASLRNW